jgi:diguanylate cyclase (GGDEF)-like protein
MIKDVDSSRERDHIFNETLALLEEAVITIDSDGNLIETSSGWLRLTRLATPTGERFLGYIHPEDREGWLLKSHQLINSDKETIHVRFRLNTNQSASPWLEGRFLAHRNSEGVMSIRGALRDVTQSYLQEQQITHMALHDALTGLANRVLLEDRLKQSLLLCARSEQQLAVLFFDLDHFKQINDSLGHKVGDKLLIALGERITACLRASDTLARWGGDEFVILLPEIADAQEVRKLTDRLIDAMQVPILIEENELPVSFSIGVAIYPNDAPDIQALFSNADRAMFHAKSQGRNQACFYSDMDYKDNGKQELYIQNRLATAIKTRQITVHYQPIVECNSGKPHAVEALARWHDERYGWVSPTTFVPMAENLGLICQLGELVLSQAFATLSQWLAQGHSLIMAINVSSRQLFSPSFIPGLMTELARYQLKTEHIILEVTESLALRDVDHAMERLQELQALGFLIAIDDFGTGHSSLAQLQEINADKLKIDRAFVMRIEDDKGHNMVKAVANMANALHLKTVAEGVETAEQKDLLCAMGVDYLQGFYFAKPMPADDCAAWWLTSTNEKAT